MEGSDSPPSSAVAISEEVERVVEQAKDLQESASFLLSRYSSDEQSLRQRALYLDSSIKRCRSLLRSLASYDPKLADKLEEDLQRTQCILVEGDVSAFLPSKPQGGFLRMFLGPINVRASRKDVQLKVKEEYNNYRGVAMLLQNQYQHQRLYTRIALGKAKRMDVVWGESAGVDGQLWLLCPILFILQGFEAYVGLQLLRTAFVRVVTEWQVIFCGFLLVFMAVGNFLNTVRTLMAKSRFKAKMKRSKSKQELD